MDANEQRARELWAQQFDGFDNEFAEALRNGSAGADSRTLRAIMAALAQQVPADGEWVPSGADYDRSIHSNPDAKAWADFFVATFPGQADKHDLMLGWFANAMMAMHDHLKQSAAQQAPQPAAGDVGRALEAAAEEIEAGHVWITREAASVVIRKHIAAYANTGQPQQVAVDGCGNHDHADFIPGCGRCAETLPVKHTTTGQQAVTDAVVFLACAEYTKAINAYGSRLQRYSAHEVAMRAALTAALAAQEIANGTG